MSKNVTNLYQHNPSSVSMPFHLTIEMMSKDKLGRNEHKMNIYLCILKRSSDSYGYASFASAILQNTWFSGRKGYEYMQHICTVPNPPVGFCWSRWNIHFVLSVLGTFVWDLKFGTWSIPSLAFYFSSTWASSRPYRKKVTLRHNWTSPSLCMLALWSSSSSWCNLRAAQSTAVNSSSRIPQFLFSSPRTPKLKKLFLHQHHSILLLPKLKYFSCGKPASRLGPPMWSVTLRKRGTRDTMLQATLSVNAKMSLVIRYKLFYVWTQPLKPKWIRQCQPPWEMW